MNNHGIFNIQSASMVEKLENKPDEQGPESMETDAKENGGNENAEMSQSNEEQQNEVSSKTLVKNACQKKVFISSPKHMLWVLKRTVSMRRFF